MKVVVINGSPRRDGLVSQMLGHVAGALPEGCEVEMLFVRDEARGRGVGRELLEYATGVLGLTRLWVNSQNGQAAGFYRRMGFRETGRCERDPEGKPYPLLRMELPGGR